MRLPIEWLKEFVEVDETPEQLAELYLGLGFEPEVIEGDVIDLDVTPNRGDVLSILGLAREYAAATGKELTLPLIPQTQSRELSFDFQMELDPKAYHRISAIIIKNVTVGPSPEWLVKRLEEMGSNSINNIVDLTNYVMFELGIPLHAFDLDQLPETNFKLRLSKEGEQFLSLKDEQRTLPADTIVVECGGEIIDLVGIRGGKSSMITGETKNVLIWAASLPRPLIRRATKLLNIRTEGSYRHERETDWTMVPTALDRITDLMLELAGGNSSEPVDFESSKLETKCIDYNPSKVNELLGTQIKPEDMHYYLKLLGFNAKGNQVTVPSWRYFDVACWEDLAEEIARIYGYYRLPRTVIQKTTPKTVTKWQAIERLKDSLTEKGFTEVYSESFVGKDAVVGLTVPEEGYAELANPVNRDFAYCRPAILPNLIKILALNSWSDDARIFEIGHAFPSKNSEETHLAIAAYGKKKELLDGLVPEDQIQLIGVDHPLAQHYKLRRPIVAAEISLDSTKLESGSIAISTTHAPYRIVSPFPPAVRDISAIISADADLNQLINDIRDTAPEQIILVEIFDRFQSDKFGPNCQSIGLHIVYQDRSKTLDTTEVDQLHESIINKLKEKYQAEIR